MAGSADLSLVRPTIVAVGGLIDLAAREGEDGGVLQRRQASDSAGLRAAHTGFGA
jgi:hypothetical protein